MKIETSLLREKFSIYDTHTPRENGPQLVAPSNRIVLKLEGHGTGKEEFIIRTRNTHSTIRMAALLLQTYIAAGPIMNRQNRYNWEEAWESLISPYERKFNPLRWVAVYNKGKPVFSSGEHHPLLDIIENFEAPNHNDYSTSLKLAEKAFKDAGKDIHIEYESNIAFLINMEKFKARCGVMFRGPERTTTFSYTITTEDKRGLNMSQCFFSAADFLEGTQLAITIGQNQAQIKLGLLESAVESHKQIREAYLRIGQMNAALGRLESTLKVRYRPERPIFQEVVEEAERVAETRLRKLKQKEDDTTTPAST